MRDEANEALNVVYLNLVISYKASNVLSLGEAES